MKLIAKYGLDSEGIYAKVKDFVKKEISRFKNLYQDEKNKTDKELITKETKYKLENKKTDEN